MAKQPSNHRKNLSDRALEMVMRDVLDGLQELSLEASLSDYTSEFQIIEIKPPVRDAERQGEHASDPDYSTEADIIEFTPLKRASG